jgi:hypothetical protein
VQLVCDKPVTRLKNCAAINLFATGEETAMSLSSHITELRKKHEALSDEVEKAARSPGSSGLQISNLKKQKLRIKEEISRLQQA